MNILVVGSGAREHAIAKSLAKTADVFTYMGRKNPGLARLSKEYEVADESDFENIIKFAQDNEIEIAFIGPEAPLEKGIVDELEKVETNLNSLLGEIDQIRMQPKLKQTRHS